MAGPTNPTGGMIPHKSYKGGKPKIKKGVHHHEDHKMKPNKGKKSGS